MGHFTDHTVKLARVLTVFPGAQSDQQWQQDTQEHFLGASRTTKRCGPSTHFLQSASISQRAHEASRQLDNRGAEELGRLEKRAPRQTRRDTGGC